MKRFAGVTALFAITLGLSIWLGSQQAKAAGARSSAATVRSSRLLLHRRVRCTATAKSVVEAGQAVRVKLTLHSVSRHPVRYYAWVFDAGVVVRAPDGTTYDSNRSLASLPGIPPPVPTKIRPGATKLLRRVAVPVRWSGPLRITPECLGKPLPALRVRVTSPGPPPDDSTAIDEVVAASGRLLDQCHPQAPGVPVYGQIDAPDWSVPSMRAECSISISSEGTFSVAHALILVPPGLAGVQIFDPYETLWPIGQLAGLAGPPPYEAVAWEFVVTSAKAIPVAASTLTATNSSSQSAPSWGWSGSGWRLDGDASCGGTAFSWGGRGPEVEFISACGG